ncbi:MAG: YggT family protein [Candidatus Omnitrophica bacterium]|nr:YggT family protein [Candidatus Omnitrophota bacterium]
MFIIAELLRSLALLISLVFNIVYFLLVIRIILSWVGSDIYNDFVRTIYMITDLVLRPFRRLPLQVGMIDFSPVVAFIVLSVAKNLFVNILLQLAARCG